MLHLVWPLPLLCPKDVLASPSSTAATMGGRTLGGALRVSNWSAGGVWRMTYERVVLRTREQILIAQALDGALDGGSTPIIVPRKPGARAPDQMTGLVPWSDGSTWSDDAMWSTLGSGDGNLVANVTKGDTVIQISRHVDLGLLIGGEDFSLINELGPELHRVVGIDSVVIDGDQRVYTVEIRTPIRLPVLAGAEVNFRNPAGRFLLSNAAEFAALLTSNRFGAINAQFVEA